MINYKYLISAILIIIFGLELIPMQNKINKMQNINNKTQDIDSFRESKKHVFLLISIISFIFFIFFGSYFYVIFKEDGPFYFNDKTTDLNSLVESGQRPVAADFATVRFRYVGDPFYVQNHSGTFYPIVVSNDESSDKLQFVYALHVDESEDEALMRSNFASQDFSSLAKLPVHQYTGRVLEIREYNDQFEEAAQKSGFTNDHYRCVMFLIETTMNKESVKKDLKIFGTVTAITLLSTIQFMILYLKYRKRR